MVLVNGQVTTHREDEIHDDLLMGETGNDERPVRVRFAPSPTGSLHIGGARTAYFNWLFARSKKGKFVLRIDDTDAKRSTEESYQQILNSFRWLGIDWDEGPDTEGPFGPYRQSLRYDIYRAELDRLQDEGKVYPCFCSPEELALEREAAQKRGETPRYNGKCRHLTREEQEEKMRAGQSYAYRLKVPTSGVTVVRDVIRGEVSFQNEGLDDFIVWKADNAPTYHFASCVDDALMQITHIIRADEHLSNTPRHVLLFQALGTELPVFAHVPMILAPDRSKLSKRHGATSVEEYREQGILPEALVNYLLLLGFSPGDDREIVSRADAVSLFDLNRVTKSAAVYDVRKLEWLNGHYLRALSGDELLDLAWPYIEVKGWAPKEPSREYMAWVRTLAQAMQERAKSVPDLVNNVSSYFAGVESYDEKGVKKHFGNVAAAERLRRAADLVASVHPFTVPRVETAYRNLIDTLGIKGGELIHPTRLALTGVTVGPGLFDVMTLLGKEVCIERLLCVATQIEAGEFAQSE